MEIKITSSAFGEGDIIPKQYTCDGVDISPPLRWSSVPENTKSFALICNDPDAPMGGWAHWVIFNLPANLNELPEKIHPQETVENGAKQGTNKSFKARFPISKLNRKSSLKKRLLPKPRRSARGEKGISRRDNS